MSLSRRQKTGVPWPCAACMRDVTQQKQRENRLALQLAVSQIVGENSAGESAGMRILEALCISQGWDVAIEWMVGAEQKHLEFGTAWGVPGSDAEALIQGSMGLALAGTGRVAGAGVEGGAHGLDHRIVRRPPSTARWRR